MSKTFDFFDNPEAARAWLKAFEMAFDGETPLSLLDTEMGAQDILRLLGQLEHGVLRWYVLTLWRLTKAQYAACAFDGEGARLYSGRWNSPGRAVVYLAGSLALATLAILVHVRSQRELSGYVKIRVMAPEASVSEVAALPPNWQQGRAPDETRAIGDAWLGAGETPLLRVPSVIIPEEHNYLLNPRHPKFGEVITGKAEPFSFDPRLREGG